MDLDKDSLGKDIVVAVDNLGNAMLEAVSQLLGTPYSWEQQKQYLREGHSSDMVGNLALVDILLVDWGRVQKD